MNPVRRIDPATLIAQPWANGMGQTTVIDSDPPGEDWTWRLSIAQLQGDAPFSTLPGVRRQFVPCDAPVRLSVNDQARELLRLQALAFEGDDTVAAELPEGPTRAFNLMLRGKQQGQLIARPLNGSMWLPARAGLRRYLHLLAGQATLRMDGQTQALAAGEHVWLEPMQATLEGGGELVLVTLA